MRRLDERAAARDVRVSPGGLAMIGYRTGQGDVMSDLDTLAEIVGIEPFYHDIWGKRRDTSDATKRALIGAMGLAASSDGEVVASLRTLEERAWRRLLPPVTVAMEGETVAVPVAMPPVSDSAGSGTHPTGGSTLAWEVSEESGARHHGTLAVDAMVRLDQTVLDGQPRERRRFDVPVRLPAGYHRLTVAIRPHGAGPALTANMSLANMSLIVAPPAGMALDEVVASGRTWGIGAQLYSLVRDDDGETGDWETGDWGMGDFGALGRLAEMAGRLGAGLVGLNPLHALFPADPNHCSPYSPSSRRFLNILYIDVPAVPEFAGDAGARALTGTASFRQTLEAARGAGLVDYAAVSHLKMPVLERLYAAFRASHLDAAAGESPRGRAFRDFQRTMGPELRRHALFEALHEHFFTTDPDLWMWPNWPQDFHHPDSPAVNAFAAEHARRVEFFEYLQWEADRQLAEAAGRGRAAGLGVGFYRDLAVAAHPGGATAWAEPDTLVHGANVGAPPDQFNMKGQNWGLSPLSPVALKERAYQPFIDLLRANMRHAGALRIDHVMALQHLFWIPADGSDGAYVEYPFEDLVRIVALESRRNGCVVIGEDLGTVPDGFRPRTDAAGVLSYRVLYFERDPEGGFLPPEVWPQRALATVTTHDLATFKGFWTGRDIEWRQRLDLYPDAAAHDRAVWDRGVERWRLVQALARAGVLPPGYRGDDGAQPYSRELAVAVHRYLAMTRAGITMLQIEDALGEVEQPNLPGTVDQHPNWRRRLSRHLEAMSGEEGAGDADLRALAAAVGEGRGGAGPAAGSSP
jgi:4-alpha-glucanotransferase